MDNADHHDFMTAKPQDIKDEGKLFTRWCWNEQTRNCIEGTFGACTQPEKRASTVEMLRQLAAKIECGDSPIVTLIVVAAEFKKGNDADGAPPEAASSLGVDLIFQGQSPGLSAAAMMVAMHAEPHIAQTLEAQNERRLVELVKFMDSMGAAMSKDGDREKPTTH